MKVLTSEDPMMVRGVGPAAMRGHHPPAGPIPPHERRALLRLEFDARDWAALREIFGDEDTARAAAAIITEAPPEIQLLALQLLDLIIEEVE